MSLRLDFPDGFAATSLHAADLHGQRRSDRSVQKKVSISGESEMETPIFVDEKNAVVLHHCLETQKSSL